MRFLDAAARRVAHLAFPHEHAPAICKLPPMAAADVPAWRGVGAAMLCLSHRDGLRLDIGHAIGPAADAYLELPPSNRTAGMGW